MTPEISRAFAMLDQTMAEARDAMLASARKLGYHQICALQSALDEAHDTLSDDVTKFVNLCAIAKLIEIRAIMLQELDDA